MKRLVWTLGAAIFALTAWSQNLEAQGTAVPFTYKEVTQEEFAKALETNDTTILRIGAGEIAAAAFPIVGRTFKTTAELATWIRSLEVRPCGSGEARLARIYTVPTRRVDMQGWVRPFNAGETCLFEDNRPAVSLQCGNFIHGAFPLEEITAEGQRIPVVPTQVVRVDTMVIAGWPALEVIHRFPDELNLRMRGIEALGRTNTTWQPVIPHQSSWFSRNWGWVVVPPAIAGLTIGAICLFTEACEGGDETNVRVFVDRN